MNNYILQRNYSFKLTLEAMEAITHERQKHYFITSFKDPISCQAATRQMMTIIALSVGDCQDPSYEMAVADMIYNVLVDMYHRQQREREGGEE